MDNNNEKDLRAYIQPEVEVIRLNSESIMAGSPEPGDEGEPI